MPRKRMGRKSAANFPDQNVQRHSLTSLETAHSLANALSWGGGAEGEVYILRSSGIAASPISLLSMVGVCGRSLTAGKILFTGRQTCSFYSVLWLCATDALKPYREPPISFDVYAIWFFKSTYTAFIQPSRRKSLPL